MAVRFQQAALLRLDDIYLYTLERWGPEQAARYSNGLFAAIDGIADGRTMSRPVPAEFDVGGFYFRYERHFIYWWRMSNGDIGIATILHERMHQMDRLRGDLGLE